ncbi:MAG: AbrB/MazE/SpoVT family DNA-binding domain-containing protein [Dehalococcoidia bacterium]
MKATVSEKGQVTIPKPLRDRLGIKGGQVIEFYELDGTFVGKKTGVVDAFDDLYGTLDLGMSTDEFINSIRGEPDL